MYQDSSNYLIHTLLTNTKCNQFVAVQWAAPTSYEVSRRPCCGAASSPSRQWTSSRAKRPFARSAGGVADHGLGPLHLRPIPFPSQWAEWSAAPLLEWPNGRFSSCLACGALCPGRSWEGEFGHGEAQKELQTIVVWEVSSNVCHRRTLSIP